MLDRLRQRRTEEGFTLIELLIVIVILGILAAVVVFAVTGITDRGKKSACKADVNTIQTAAEAYNTKNGAYPSAGTSAARINLMIPDFLRTAPSSSDYTVSLDAAGAVTSAPACDAL